MINKLLISLFVSVAFSYVADASQNINLGSASKYNAIVFGDFTANSSDVEGRLAVKGDVNINHYSVGDKLDSSQIHDTLISGGDIVFPSGRVYFGHILASGSVNGIGSAVSNGMASGSDIAGSVALPLDFSTAYTELNQLAQSLSQLTVNTTFENKWGGLYLHGDCSSDTQAFNLDGPTVLNSHTFQVDCIPDDAYVVINISGASPGLTNMSLATLENHRDRVIYNFYEANSLTLAGIGVEGTVLAPNADINNPQGVIKGQLVANSWNGMMQINNHLFEGQVVVGNQSPIANDAEYEISSDESISFELSASDLNNDVLNYQVNATSLLGELTGTAPNFTYTPLPGFTGTDQFSFLVNDGAFNSATATVSFYVGRTQCELYPFALEGEQFLSLQVGQQVENYATSVGAGNYSLLTWDGSNDTNTLATSFIMPGDSFNYVNPDDVNDQDINIGDWVQGAPGKNNAKHVRNALDDLLGHEITVPLWSQTRGSGSNLDYEVVDFARIELTSYKLNGQSNIGFIYHGKADCGNFAPFTLDAEIATNKNESIAFVLGGSNEVIDGVQNLLAVINSDQDPLTFELVTEPQYGILSGSGPEFTYLPNNDFVGMDTFEFKVNDGYVDSNVSTVTIEIIQTNLSPVAFDQSLQVNENESLNIILSGEDPDNDSLTYQLVNQPLNGQVTGTLPDLIYTPDTNYFGLDTFTFTVNDGEVSSQPATIFIEVLAVNDPPVAFADSLTTDENLSIDFTLQASDPDGDTLVYQITSQPINGSLVGTLNNYTYTPNSFYEGTDSFEFIVNDGEFDSNTATVSIEVIGHGNNPPNIISEPVRVLSVIDRPIGDPELVNLSTWQINDFNYSYDNQRAPDWRFNSDYTVATQYVNARASALLSDFNFSNQQITGNFKVDTNGDDDYIGFVFGFQNKYQHNIFLWKKGAQGFALRGMAVWNINLNPDGSEGEPQFNPRDLANDTRLYQNDIGWKSNTDYQFNLSYQNNEITITVIDVGNNQTLDSFTVYDDTFGEGKFGFYNWSQSRVQYSGFERQLLAEETYYYDVMAIDPDGDELTYELLEFPSGMAIDPLTGLITWQANSQQVGVYSISVLVTDPFGATDTQLYELVISNDEPVIVSKPITNTYVGAAYVYNIEAYDPNPSDVISFALSNAPVGMTVTEYSGVINWQPADSDIGSHDVVLEVTDLQGNTTTQDYVLTVSEAVPNEAPVFTTQPSLTAQVGRLYTYTPMATDADGDTVSIALSKIPYDMQMFDGETVTWIPTSDQITDHDIELVAVDSLGAETKQAFTITVSATNNNNPPAINSLPETAVVVNSLYQYQVIATDPENDPLNYALVVSPNGMSINPLTGYLSWVPDSSQFGFHEVILEVTDNNGGYIQQRFEVTVFEQLGNNPPIISSQAPNQAVENSQYIYDVIASDSDNNELVYSLIEAPQNMAIDSITGRVEWTVATSDIGQNPVTLEVNDQIGGFVRQSFVINVTQAIPNRAPEILSAPIFSAYKNQPYEYQVLAIDLDGDAISYQLSNHPMEMTISQSGLISWLPDSMVEDEYTINVEVSDQNGGMTIQTYTLNVTEENLPGTNEGPVISSIPMISATIGMPYSYQIIVSDANNDALTYEVLAGFDGASIDQQSGLLTWVPSELGLTPVSIGVSDGQITAVQSWTLAVNELADLTVDIVISPSNPLPGDDVTVLLIPVGAVGEVSLTATYDGLPLDLDSLNQGIIENITNGIHQLEVSMTDLNSNATVVYPITVNDGTASQIPEVDILSPADGSIITGFNDVEVRVQDDNLASWKLSYRYAEDDFTGRVTLAEGTGTIDDAVVANWDTSLLRNGIYVLLIEATDLSGQRSSVVHSVFLEGDLKLGHFSIAFEDMNIPVAGIPVTITRGYDTRDRNRDRAFGKGWSIGFESVRVQESRIPGLAWYMETGFYSIGPVRLPRYCVRPASEALVSVLLPNGQVEKFKVKAKTLNPASGFLSNCQNIITPDYFGIEFIPQGDTNSTITSNLGQNNLKIINGNLEELTAFTPVDPNQYTLTMLDGTEYALDQGFNVRKIKTTSGHELRFTENGIEHSGGLSVEFIRDTQGRITRIEKANGDGVDYEYNSEGDLVSFTDLNGNTTTYTYIQDHFLEDIIDPRGIRVARNEYDNGGRLVAHIDAEGNRIEYDNDLIARTSTITDRRGNRTINAFDNAGNIIAQTNALGETTNYEYNYLRLEESRTNHLGHRTEWTYDAQGNQLTETDPLGHITTSTYNRKAELLTQIDALGQPVITNEYNPDYDPQRPEDPQHGYAQLKHVTDALGRITQFHWLSGINANTEQSISVNTGYTDSAGNRYDISPISGGSNDGLSGGSTDLNGLRTETTYDDEARPLTETQVITDEFGIELARYTTSYEYNSNGDVITMTDALGNVTRTEYDSLNKVSATIDALGRRTEMEYDDRGNHVLTRYPDGSTEAMVYDEENNVIESTDRAGRVTKTIYDALNRVDAVIYPDDTPADDADNPMTVNSYDGAGRLVAVSDANGNVTSYEYDDAGRRTKTTDSLGNETTSVYDALGRRTQSTDALGRVTTFQYNALGNLERTNFDIGLFITVEYDDLSRKVAETDLAGVRTEYEYDAAGNLTAVIDALSQRTEYSYDQRGNKLTQTDARGNTTSWAYDALNRVTSRTLPEGEVETYTYNAVGNRISKTDFNGDTTTYEYNNLNQLVLTSYSDSTTVANTYSITGQMETVTEINGTTTYSYDSQDRLIRIDYPTGNYIEYAYDLNGNRTQVQTANQTVDYTFDQLNRLKTVTNSSGTTTYTYDAVGNRASQINANGTVATYTYDDLNRLTDLVHTDALNTILASYSYELGPNGNRLSLTEGTGRYVEYDYDDLYRLLSETVTDPINGDHSSQWAYDAVGNRLQQEIDGIITLYTYNDNDHLLTETKNSIVTRYDYDDNGNTLTKTIDTVIDTTYSYSKDNRMLTADTSTSSISYSYDAGGIRQSQTVNGQTINYLVDPNRSYHQVLEEQDDLFMPQVVYTYGDDLINQTNAQGIHVFGYDGLGSTRILTDTSGAVQNSYGYQAFGELDYEFGSIENNYLFTGEQYDNNVGFYYLRARFYNPSIGRFHSMDTFPGMQFEPVTLHKYLYANVNPVTVTDPSGYVGIIRLMTGANVLANIQTWTTISVNVLTGNYAVAAGQIAEEVVYAKLGVFGKPLSKLSDKAANLFYNAIGRSVKLKKGVAATGDNLAYNLNQVGVSRPPNTSAHHIVAGNGARAQRARDVLDDFEIDINSPNNGVFLANSADSPAIGALHSGGHTNAYFDEVNERIIAAAASGDKLVVLNTLGQIKVDLLTGALTVQNKVR